MTHNQEIKNNTQQLSVIGISILVAFFSHVILFFVSNYSSLYFAYDFDIQAFIGEQGIVYLTPISDTHWTFDALTTILLSRPIASFFLGMASLVLLLFINKKAITWLYFLLWMTIWGINGAIGLLVDDAIFGIGTYEVAKAMDFSFSFILVIGFLSAYFLFLVGILISKLYFVHLIKAPFYKKNRRPYLILTTIVIPWLLVVVVNYGNWIPDFSFSELFKNLTAILLILPFFFFNDRRINIALLRSWNNPSRIDFFYLTGLMTITVTIIYLLINNFSIIG